MLTLVNTGVIYKSKLIWMFYLLQMLITDVKKVIF